LAEKAAKDLYNAGEGRLGTDEEAFIRILSENSHQQLALIFKEYEKISGKIFIQAVEEEMGGGLRKGIEILGMRLLVTDRMG
jgi:annexin A7/11